MYNNTVVKKTIYISDELVDIIEKEARNNHRSFTAQVTYALAEMYTSRNDVEKRSEDE